MIVKNISIKLLQLVKAYLSYKSVLWQTPKLVIGGVNILDMNCNNSYIRKCHQDIS